jgi:hypothetical protein
LVTRFSYGHYVVQEICPCCSSDTQKRDWFKLAEVSKVLFVPKLKFNGKERISSNYHEFADALHQAAAMKFGAIARVIKLNDWPLLPMPGRPVTDEAKKEDYKE